MTTAYMLLDLPVVSTTLGPTWATMVNTALTTIDAHDHTGGKGTKVPAAGLSISADVDFNAGGSSTGNNATGLRAVRMVSQSAAPSGTSDVGEVANVGGDLHWIFNSTTAVKITSGGGINTTGLASNTWARTSVSTDITIGASDTFAFYDVSTSGGARNITLPACASVPGKYYTFKVNSASNALTLTPNAVDSINGGTVGASLVMPTVAQGEWRLWSDGQSTGDWKLERSSQDLNHASVPAGGSLTTNHVLKVSGTKALSYGYVVDANVDSAAAITGTKIQAAASGNVGVVQLTQDFGGTSTTPTVVSITGTAGAFPIRSSANILTWDAATTTPGIKQTAAGSGAGANLTITAQNAGTASSAGGKLVLQSGSDLTAGETAGGAVEFKVGALSKFQIISGSASNATLRQTPLTGTGSGGSMTISGQAGLTSGNGGSVAVTGGAGAASGDNGGGLTLSTGASGGGSGIKGVLLLQGGNSGLGSIRIQEVAAGRNVVVLTGSASLAGTDVPSGDGMIYVPTTSTAAPDNRPAAGAGNAPVGGCLLFFDGTNLYIRKPGAAGNTVIV